MFDEMFSSNTFTIYTNATINDDDSLSTAVNVALSNYYYWENDDTYYNINFYNCRYSNMTCENFYVYRSNPSEEIKTYQNIVINVVSDLDEYFPMVNEDNNITINYDEEFFSNNTEKNNYIVNYLSGFNSYDNNNSISYAYDTMTKTITRTDSNNNIFSMVYKREINDVVFNYVDSEYSSAFSRLTNDGNVTIDTDSELTTELLNTYINWFDTYSTDFRLDGSIKNNQAFVKKCDRVGNLFDCNEIHKVTFSRNTDVSKYFSMVNNENNVVIDYSEEMFANDEEKNNYILSYFNSFNTYMNSNSTNYSYDSNSKILLRIDSFNGNTVAVHIKTINNVIFGFEETPYSDDFKVLTTDGNLTIKTDADITTDILQSYFNYKRPNANNYNLSFNADGQISNNKIFVKLCNWVDGTQQCNEKHLITLVKDSNINYELYNKIGLGDYYNIEVPEPENKSDFFMSFNSVALTNIDIENNDNTNDYYYIRFEYPDYSNAVILFTRSDSDNNLIDIQFHRVPIRFVGYNNTVTDAYSSKVGDGIVINADSLDLNTINQNIGSNLRAFNCNNDFSMCDVAYTDYDANTVEIHRVPVTLNNEVSEEFKEAFNIKDDGSIDILKDSDVEVDVNSYTWLDYNKYDEQTSVALTFDCYSDSCLLSYRNYSSGKVESHSVPYNFVNSGRTDYYSSKVKEEVELYPGEMTNVWDTLKYSNNVFFKGTNDYSIRPSSCDIEKSKCTIAVFNQDKKIEMHNSTVTLKNGRSPEFDELFPNDTLSINSIYLDNSLFLEDASVGYLVDKTKKWSYVTDFSNGTAKVVYDGFETHTMNIEFEEMDQNIKQIIDEAKNRIMTQIDTIVVDDLEFINNFYYNSELSFLSMYNSQSLYSALSKVINNNHISYNYFPRAGDTGPFGSGSMGGVVLYYDGIAYGRAGELTQNENHVLFIPDNTENTTEAYIRAAQARIDEYLGENSGLTISYGREAYNNEVAFNILGIDQNNYDGNVYILKYKDKEANILIVKDSSKMKNSTFNAIDAGNNVVVSSDEANYPTNTVVSFENVDASLQQYQDLLNQLGLTNAQIINVDLFSPTFGNITQFNNVTFNVSFPINIVNYQNKTLYAYFIGPNGIEEHPITVNDFLGTYSTTHFSTYIISEKVESSSVTNVAITSNKDSVNFGELEKGFSDNSVQKVTITNTGDVPVTLAVTTIPTSDGPFAVYAVDGSQEIAPNGTMEISLIAKSSSPFSSIAGDYSGVYEITATEVGGTRTAKVSVTANAKIVEPQEDPVVPVSNTSISYTTHVQDIGWQEYVSNGEMAGTEGQAKRLEGIKIKLIDAPYAGDIEYRTHIQNIGWESSFKKNDEMSGTSGQALRLEAIEIKLTGEMANHYDIYYRVHAQNFGWLGWARNGEQSGTAGYAYRLEGIEIKLVAKGTKFEGYGDKETFVDATTGKVMPIKDDALVAYTTHVENIGWQPYVTDGKMAGTQGQALRLEGIKIKLVNQQYTGDIEYRTHIQNVGWETGFKKNDEMSGTSGRALRLEAIEIKLTGEMADHYDIYYRVHAQNFGWLGWAKNGEQAGTAGFAYRLEGIEIKLVPKGENPSFINGLQPFYKN